MMDLDLAREQDLERWATEKIHWHRKASRWDVATRWLMIVGLALALLLLTVTGWGLIDAKAGGTIVIPLLALSFFGSLFSDVMQQRCFNRGRSLGSGATTRHLEVLGRVLREQGR